MLTRRDFLKLIGLAGLGTLGFSDWYPPFFVYHGDRNSKKIALTFDDGWDEENVEQVIHILNRHNINSSFFIVGKMLDKYPEIWRHALDSGHRIYSHTESHRQILNADDTIVEYQTSAWEESYLNLDRGEPYRLIRLPGLRGMGVPEVENKLRKAGYEAAVGGSLSSEDYYWHMDSEFNAKKIYKNVVSNLRGGDIIVCHFLPSIIRALSRIIKEARNLGYEFVELRRLPGVPFYDYWGGVNWNYYLKKYGLLVSESSR